MNENFKGEVQKKDNTQKKILAASFICFFLGIASAYTNIKELIFFFIILSGILFLIGLFSGRSIADDIAYKTAQAQAPTSTCMGCNAEVDLSPNEITQGKWECPVCHNVNKV